ncbi:hypothetical protein [Fulvivirga aurantia]|uniref:hypothetical protein n=1 Tax=Fulvivirga aurantia TaxID=2529383 RepID=UPI0012BB96CE|nr:hypothetical protein [Fulvivirga aurantia]
MFKHLTGLKMKNVIVVALVVLFVSALASCSTYTCPTYAKAPVDTQEVEQEKENI